MIAPVTVEQVLERLEHVRPLSTGGWSARCPAHEDQRPSLSVGRGERQELVLDCFAGCSFEAVLRALGLYHGPTPVRELGVRPVALHPPAKALARAGEAPVLECTYTYQDEDCHPLYYVCRYRYTDGRKTFRQYHLVDDERVWNLEGVRRVLYNLPSLLRQHPRTPVFLVEGERDVHSLLAAGLVATCLPGGAVRRLDPRLHDLVLPLCGRQVAVIPDNDQAGYTHARVCCAALAEIALPRLVELPDLPPGGDTTDYLQAGDRARRLSQLILWALSNPLWS